MPMDDSLDELGDIPTDAELWEIPDTVTTAWATQGRQRRGFGSRPQQPKRNLFHRRSSFDWAAMSSPELPTVDLSPPRPQRISRAHSLATTTPVRLDRSMSLSHLSTGSSNKDRSSSILEWQEENRYQDRPGKKHRSLSQRSVFMDLENNDVQRNLESTSMMSLHSEDPFAQRYTSDNHDDDDEEEDAKDQSFVSTGSGVAPTPAPTTTETTTDPLDVQFLLSALHQAQRSCSSFGAKSWDVVPASTWETARRLRFVSWCTTLGFAVRAMGSSVLFLQISKTAGLELLQDLENGVPPPTPMHKMAAPTTERTVSGSSSNTSELQEENDDLVASMDALSMKRQSTTIRRKVTLDCATTSFLSPIAPLSSPMDCRPMMITTPRNHAWCSSTPCPAHVLESMLQRLQEEDEDLTSCSLFAPDDQDVQRRRRAKSFAKRKRMSLWSSSSSSTAALTHGKTMFRPSLHPLSDLGKDMGLVQEEAEASWKDLPNDVFGFLNDSEGRRMSLVCTDWARAVVRVQVDRCQEEYNEISTDLQAIHTLYPVGSYLSEGAFKRVYKVVHAQHQITEAVSVM